MKSKKFLRGIGVLLMLLPAMAYGQQQALFSQYMFNGLGINPAYAGMSGSLDIAALARWQWVGIEGAPTTTTLSAHAPIQSKKIGLGLTISRDEIGITDQTTVFAAYAYRLQVGKGHLSMGLQGGFTSFNGNYNDLYTLNPDVTFQGQASEFLPNAGAGLFYHTAVYYVGFSAPMLIQNKIQNNSTDIFTQRRQYFLTSGAVVNLSRHVKAKPNILVNMVDGAPVSVDYNVNFLFNEVIWFGVSYRPPESLIFITQLDIDQRFRIGYAYDHIIERTLSNVASSSHEILLSYRIKLVKNSVTTPRYF